MMFLLGRHAMLGQDPPIYLRSTTATRLPCLARVQARYFEPSPLPKITRSYSSGSASKPESAGVRDIFSFLPNVLIGSKNVDYARAAADSRARTFFLIRIQSAACRVSDSFLLQISPGCCSA